MIRVFIGFDRQETIAFHVAAYSIMRRASVPVMISGLLLPQLPLTRPRHAQQSTDFAFSRFLVPWLCEYEGAAIFMDCDMLCRADIAELWALAPAHDSVAVVQHEYVPKDDEKFLGHEQTTYNRKNWSSVMVFNNARCRTLTPEYVNSAAGLELQQFAWAHGVAALPREWNHLVGEYDKNENAKLVHFTLGTPCFKKYRFSEFAGEWFDERDAMEHYDVIGEYSRPERNEEAA